MFGSAVLISTAARHGVAEHYAASSNPNEWIRAAILEPSNAENWYRLGRYRQLDFENSDLPLAISYYRRAVAINPHSARYWMDLAAAYESAGALSEAERAFRTAQLDYPISADVAWGFGNFLLRQNRIHEAFQQMHQAISVDPKLTELAVSRCWRSTQDVQQILSAVLPDNPDAYWGAIDFFVDARNPHAAAAVWKALATDRASFPLAKAFPLVEMLIATGDATDAVTAWRQALSAAGVATPAAGQQSLIWDGSFEHEVLNGGFGWHDAPVAGADFAWDQEFVHTGGRSLRIVFDGSTNLNFSGIWQFVAVDPSTHYRFSAFFRTQDLTTDSGIRFEMSDVSHPENLPGWKPEAPRYTPDVVGTQEWLPAALDFETGAETRLLRITLRRTPSGLLANRIRGTVWVDDVSLTPMRADAAAAK